MAARSRHWAQAPGSPKAPRRPCVAECAAPRPGACAARARNQRPVAVRGARSGRSCGRHRREHRARAGACSGPGSRVPDRASPCSPEQQPAFPSWSEHGGVAPLCPG